ncbi:MAG: hypothetical protein P8Z31_01475 [Gammaproteobacteria bacterium]
MSPVSTLSILAATACRPMRIVFLLAILPGAAASADESGPCDLAIDGVTVESSRPVEGTSLQRMALAEFNAIIAEIPARQESWIMDPVRVVLEYLGTPGARAVSIRRCDAAGERARETSVWLLEDGYLDDSVRGAWYNFILGRDDAGRWLIKEGREAYRCWRGHHQQSYSEQSCS